MTRETKIGLAVAASFLCLVGIVVATKWRPGEVDQNVAPTPPGQTASPGSSASKTPDKKATAVAAAAPATNPQFRVPGSNEESANTAVPAPGQANAGNNSGAVVLPLAPNVGNDNSVPKL